MGWFSDAVSSVTNSVQGLADLGSSVAGGSLAKASTYNPLKQPRRWRDGWNDFNRQTNGWAGTVLTGGADYVVGAANESPAGFNTHQSIRADKNAAETAAYNADQQARMDAETAATNKKTAIESFASRRKELMKRAASTAGFGSGSIPKGSILGGGTDYSTILGG